MYCKRCCQLLTRPQLAINEEGVCGACQWEDEKKSIDWDKRLHLLYKIVEEAKVKAFERDTYDCALGVSGGKDSLFTALYAKEQLGLNCLLISAAPDEITEIGRQNFENLLSKGFDCIRIHTDTLLIRQLMCRDFFKYLHFRKANEYPLWASTYRIAKMHNIPLIIQGENAALTLGVSLNINADWDASTVYKTNTIAGATAFAHFSETPRNKLYTYEFPKWRGKAIWLNYFVKEWGQYHNAQFAIERGLRVSDDSLENMGRIYNWTCLDSDFHIVSQFHKFVKFGFGFATDEVCYDIRDGRMTREEGFELIDKYDGNCADHYIEKFCRFIGITRKEHDETVDKFANRDLLEKDKIWKLKEEIKEKRYS